MRLMSEFCKLCFRSKNLKEQLIEIYDDTWMEINASIVARVLKVYVALLSILLLLEVFVDAFVVSGLLSVVILPVVFASLEVVVLVIKKSSMPNYLKIMIALAIGCIFATANPVLGFIATVLCVVFASVSGVLIDIGLGDIQRRFRFEVVRGVFFPVYAKLCFERYKESKDKKASVDTDSSDG